MAPFDGLAADYDRGFTDSSIGRRMRDAVWRRLDEAFAPGDRVLELNCGTGEDAAHLGARGVRILATDSSPAMLTRARTKIEAASLADMVDVQRLRIEDLADNTGLGTFDGAISNFGGLNCVEDLPRVARRLAELMRPGAKVLLCLMGPTVPWEWAWYLAHGEPQTAARRLRRGGASWRGVTVRYPTIGRVRRAFAPHFRARRVAAVGALLPPTFAEAWAARHPRLLRALDIIERRFEAVWPLPWLADHFLIEFDRERVL